MTEPKMPENEPKMLENEVRPRVSIIREFAKTPIKSIGTPRRVLVDSKGVEVSKTPRNSQATPFSKPPKCRIPSACTTPSKPPCQIQVCPSLVRNHSISSKPNDHSQIPGPCTPRGLKLPNISGQKANDHSQTPKPCTPRGLKLPNISGQEAEKSVVILKSEMLTEKENEPAIKDEFANKENTPHKEGITNGRKSNFSLRGLSSELARFQKRENFMHSPASRVEVKDGAGCGKRRKVSEQRSSSSARLHQRKKIDHDV